VNAFDSLEFDIGGGGGPWYPGEGPVCWPHVSWQRATRTFWRRSSPFKTRFVWQQKPKAPRSRLMLRNYWQTS